MQNIKNAMLLTAITLTALTSACASSPAGIDANWTHANWTQWGGPHHNFKADDAELADTWPEAGPPVLWKRALAEGYSAIIADGDRLYTMGREGEKETTFCLRASNGKTIWKDAYDSSPPEKHINQFGRGPRSTPLIVDDKIYTIGVSGVFRCLDKRTGKLRWQHDLLNDFGGSILPHGYSSSPILHKNTIITLVGGEDQSIVAFNRDTGKVVWKKHSFTNSYSTPRILNVLGKPQLVTFMATEVVGLDPDTGDLKWSFPHSNKYGQNICMPIIIDDILLISAHTVGAKGLKISRVGDDFSVEEIWATKKIQFYHVTSIDIGDYVYGSTGTRTPAFMAAINVKTGEVAWRKRGFAKANCLYADDKFIILDEDGQLALATATPEDLTIHAKTNILEKVTWTVPTLVGNTLYIRDKKEILALDLG